ncbi:MAG TPA: glycerol-3-phosphate dehydrogenase/oxidase [Mycobacteriales bacterium]|nr:glycerol-3-phosphate dehydrogenase/oxidase [Mycobacteriales bacterium]
MTDEPLGIRPGSALTAQRRGRELEQTVGGRVDVLVVGGGVTGCGVALDAASRGLSVALVERDDLASGTSRWSSKLVHGGLRYLAQGDLALARESAVERAVLMGRTAPHLVRALPMVIPILAGTGRRDALLVELGHRAAHLLSAGPKAPHARLPRPRRLSAPETLALLPALDPAGLRGANLGYDGQLEDDARLVVGLARTAAAFGARILTRVRVTRLAADGAQILDTITGAGGWISARTVVSATGVWAGTLDEGVRLQPSKGSHLVLRSAALGHPAAAMTVAVPGERNRYVFALPQPDGLTFLGLTDDPLEGMPPDEPEVTQPETDFLLRTFSAALRRPLTRADVVGAFAGLRPLVSGSTGRTADLSRRHTVTRGATGAFTVVGGKLTTYRKMAQDTVDALCRTLGHPAPCRTADLPLVGAEPAAGAPERPAGAPDPAAGAPDPPAGGPDPAAGGLDPVRAGAGAGALPPRLVRRYGSEAGAVAAAGSLEPVAAGVPVLRAELAFGVAVEGALTVEDLLARRTRLALVPAWAEAARPAAQEALAATLRP